MANQDRTEKATPKHRERARKKGQVARSSDVGGSLVLAAGLFAITLLGPTVVSSAESAFRAIFAEIAQPARATTAGGLHQLLDTGISTLGLTLGPIAAICLGAGLFAGVAQVGFRPAPRGLTMDFKRINPISGMRNLFGPNLVFETLKAVAKVGLVAGVAALALLPGMSTLASEVGIPPGALGIVLGRRGMEVAQHAAFAYLAIAAIDYAWQRRRHERGLRMTKQELKDELRQYGLPAEVRAAQRRRQMQAARNRMMAAVPDADVIVANPTHYAVALRYDGSRTAPEVVAKGKDLIALQIRRIAEEHDVPVVSDPPLARALHGSCEIGQIIPEELYAAVARVLAFVYRIARQRRYAL
ncbi:MAG TPA: EscU/YscU/HrcU family type III secretion system export apparatus switch protein [Solirubrobacteraceae bacterium]|jgi:flagellar biosynthetic protein FlhB|nr:EscU/YscU/HrcU family type III secretion system export apparatus switch protein [Solirubrobacteraceae bacterium]